MKGCDAGQCGRESAAKSGLRKAIIEILEIAEMRNYVDGRKAQPISREER